jgi:hypothetical protein
LDVTPCSLAVEELAVSFIKTDRPEKVGRRLLSIVVTNIPKYKAVHSITEE